MTRQAAIFISVLLFAAIAALVFFAPSRLPQDTEVAAPPVSTPAPAPVEGKLEPRREPEQAIEPEGGEDLADLPSLPESDPVVRDRLSDLSAKPQWRNWLANGQLVRRAASLIARLANGEVDRRAVAFLAPEGKFAATETPGGRYLLDPSGYRRYNPVAEVIESVDAKALAQSYRNFGPLFQTAFAELGYPDRDFDSTLLQAIDLLLATPALKGEIELIRPSVMYKFADSRIEGLRPAQKQLIRMGPRNMQKIQGKLRELRAQLVSAGGG
jgi:hypothetical protein